MLWSFIMHVHKRIENWRIIKYDTNLELPCHPQILLPHMPLWDLFRELKLNKSWTVSHNNSFYDYDQWRSQPDFNLVMLCKYFCVHRPRKQSISKEMNNDNDLEFA